MYGTTITKDKREALLGLSMEQAGLLIEREYKDLINIVFDGEPLDVCKKRKQRLEDILEVYKKYQNDFIINENVILYNGLLNKAIELQDRLNKSQYDKAVNVLSYGLSYPISRFITLLNELNYNLDLLYYYHYNKDPEVCSIDLTDTIKDRIKFLVKNIDKYLAIIKRNDDLLKLNKFVSPYTVEFEDIINQYEDSLKDYRELQKDGFKTFKKYYKLDDRIFNIYSCEILEDS